MGAIELQVFVSLVVILGAAFVALICDFLKGNNEQLRESNLELRVRQDERDKRDLLVEQVQRQTIEVVTQVQRAAGQRPAMKAQAAVKAAPVAAAQAPTAAGDVRALFEQAEQARQGRSRRERRNAGENNSPVASAEVSSPAAWAQEVYLRRFPQAGNRRAVSEVVEEPAKVEAAPQAEQEDIRVALKRARAPQAEPLKAQPEPEPAVAEAVRPEPPVVEKQPEMAGKIEVPVIPVRLAAGVLGGGEPMAGRLEGGLPPARVEVSERVPAEAASAEIALAPVGSGDVPAPAHVSSLNAVIEGIIPSSGLRTEAVEQSAEAAEAEAVAEDATARVVRIRVLKEEDVVAESAPAEAEAAQAEAVTGEVKAEPAAEVVAEAQESYEAESEILAASEPVAEMWMEPVAEVWMEPATVEAEMEPVAAEAGVERPEAEGWAEQPMAEAPAAEVQAEPAAAVQEQPWLELELESLSAAVAGPVFETQPGREEIKIPALEAAPMIQLAEEMDAVEPEPEATASKSNVVEMPAGAAPRPLEAAAKEEPGLVVPGGYHEPQALARLMQEEPPFSGLAMVVSLVDYVRLMADQGKPAMEQLMGSVSRLVVSMTREQDFACRISEDEFVLLFVREGGAAAKRRVQMVSERLWDYQLRSLGSVSIIFSWGVAESAGEPLAQVVERAREQMMETRRNRRSFSGAGRFRRVAND